jgi:hypothetical protein
LACSWATPDTGSATPVSLSCAKATISAKISDQALAGSSTAARFAFLLAWLANQAGLAIIVGAFAAGMILNDFFDKELEGESLHHLCRRPNPWALATF